MCLYDDILSMSTDIQSAVIHVALSPPSHTSTPATSGQCKIQPHLGESPSKLPGISCMLFFTNLRWVQIYAIMIIVLDVLGYSNVTKLN